MARFDSLSDEILLYLRTIISSLPSHVALAQCCKRLRELYSKDDTFWQFACFSSGFGRPRTRRGLGARLSWREIAHLLASHQTKCQINSCRDANGCFEEHYRVSQDAIWAPRTDQTDVILHPLYFYLHFSHLPSDDLLIHAPLPDVLTILHTHLPTYPESKQSQYGPLCSHPNASCAFATFPPMVSLSFQDANGQTFLIVENPDGCTILDVNRALAELIPRDIGPLETALQHYRDLMLFSGLSSAEFAYRISQQRGFLGDHEYPFLQDLMAQSML